MQSMQTGGRSISVISKWALRLLTGLVVAVNPDTSKPIFQMPHRWCESLPECEMLFAGISDGNAGLSDELEHPTPTNTMRLISITILRILNPITNHPIYLRFSY